MLVLYSYWFKFENNWFATQMSSSLQNYDIQASQKDGDVNIDKIVKLDEMEMENQKNCNILLSNEMKWNESGFRPPLRTYRLNWARRTSWGWWDDWDDTVLQTQDSKFEPWRSEAEHATSRSRRLPTILTFTRRWGRNNFVSFKPPRPGTEPRTLAWKAAVLTTTLGPPPILLSKNKHFYILWFYNIQKKIFLQIKKFKHKQCERI